MDYFKYFARYYRAFYTYKSDVQFWARAADKYARRNPILYIGPGTGRLMKELLIDHEIVAVERSPAMCKELKKEIEESSEGRPLKTHRIYNVDIRQFNEPISSTLAIMPCNVLTENNSEEAVKEILMTCHKLLQANGCIAVQVDNAAFFPCRRTLTVEKEVTIPNFFKGVRRTWVQHVPENRKLILEIELIQAKSSLPHRLIRFEHFAFTLPLFKRMAAETGFEVIELYGNAKHMNPFDTNSSNIIAIMRKMNAKHN
jgi:hypothetical protein